MFIAGVRNDGEIEGEKDGRRIECQRVGMKEAMESGMGKKAAEARLERGSRGGFEKTGNKKDPKKTFNS